MGLGKSAHLAELPQGYLWKEGRNTHFTKCCDRTWKDPLGERIISSKGKVQVTQWKFVLDQLPRSGHQTDVEGRSSWVSRLLERLWAWPYVLVSAVPVIKVAVSEVS